MDRVMHKRVNALAVPAGLAINVTKNVVMGCLDIIVLKNVNAISIMLLLVMPLMVLVYAK